MTIASCRYAMDVKQYENFGDMEHSEEHAKAAKVDRLEWLLQQECLFFG